MEEDENHALTERSFDWLSRDDFYKIVDNHLANVHPRFRDKNIVDDDLARRAIEVLESNDTKLHRDIRQWVQRNYNVLIVENHKYLASKSEKRGKIGLKVVVRSKMYDIVCGIHDKDHVGQNGTWLSFRKDWTGVPQHVVKEVVNQCAKCQGHHTSLRNPESANRPAIPARFLQRVQIDIIELINHAVDGYSYVLYLHDYFSKWSWARALKDKDAKSVAIVLHEIFLEWGCPIFLQDGDPRESVTEYINELTQLWPECKILRGQPHAQEQGVESASNVFKTQIGIWMERTGRRDWNVGLSLITNQMNRVISSATGIRPYDVVFALQDHGVNGIIDDLWEQGHRNEADLPENVVVEYGIARFSDQKKRLYRRKVGGLKFMNPYRIDNIKHKITSSESEDTKVEEPQRKRTRGNSKEHTDNDSSDGNRDEHKTLSQNNTRNQSQSSLLTGLYSWVWPPASNARA